MSAGKRDQRLKIYVPTESGTDGVTSKDYIRLTTLWGVITPPTGGQRMMFGYPETRIDAVAVFADEAVITHTDLIVDEDDAVWEVRAVMARRRRRELQVGLERSTQAVGSYLLLES